MAKNHLGKLSVKGWIHRNEIGSVTIKHKDGSVSHHDNAQLQRQIEIAQSMIDSGKYSAEQCEKLEKDIRMWQHGLTL